MKYKNLDKYQYDNFVISPGLIDIHVHLNEPKQETWESKKSHLKFSLNEKKELKVVQERQLLEALQLL